LQEAVRSRPAKDRLNTSPARLAWTLLQAPDPKSALCEMKVAGVSCELQIADLLSHLETAAFRAQW